MNIKYIAKQITEDGLVKPVYTKVYSNGNKNYTHKIPLDDVFDTEQEVIDYLNTELKESEKDMLFDNNIVILTLVTPL